jgi:serine/threonine protein kinase/Flp pilus assembly protein TadD
MTGTETPPPPTGLTPPSPALSSQILDLFRLSRPADVRSYLDRHPELARNLNLVKELACQEYRQHWEAGEAPDLGEFCARFPECRQALEEMLGAERFLREHRDWWRHEAVVPWPEAGDVYLGFALVRELGRGSFSRVFLAHQLACGGRDVVVKVTRLPSAEAATLARLEHRNIVPVLTVEPDDVAGLAAVCMPYLGSATLEELCRRVAAGPALPCRARLILETASGERPPAGPLAAAVLRRGGYVRGVLHLAVQLADALAFIHAHGVCHRDLKPSNVLLTPDGRPMLLDFNLSADPVAGTGMFGGTLSYMPPEQLRATFQDGNADDVDARSDVYALGVLLYELLTGKHPFKPPPGRPTSNQLLCDDLLRRQRQGPVAVRDWNPAVAPAVARLVERCLAFVPADRPQGAAAVARALRRAESPVRRAGRWLAGPGLRAAVLVTAAVVATTASVTPRPSTPAVVPQVDMRRSLVSGAKALDRGANGPAVALFTEVLEAEPNNRAAILGRARAYKRLGKFDLALADFTRADELIPEGRVRACRAYCLNQLGRAPDEALKLYEDALRAGMDTPEVRNNLGYTRFRLRNNVADLYAALSDMNVALQQNPCLQSARSNRARIQLQLYLRGQDRFLSAAIRDIELAIDLGPETADLDGQAVELYGRAALRGRGAGRTHWETKALTAIRRAIEMGSVPGSFANLPCLATLRDDPRLREVLTKTERTANSHQAVRYLDPCP